MGKVDVGYLLFMTFILCYSHVSSRVINNPSQLMGIELEIHTVSYHGSQNIQGPGKHYICENGDFFMRFDEDSSVETNAIIELTTKPLNKESFLKLLIKLNGISKVDDNPVNFLRAIFSNKECSDYVKENVIRLTGDPAFRSMKKIFNSQALQFTTNIELKKIKLPNKAGLTGTDSQSFYKSLEKNWFEAFAGASMGSSSGVKRYYSRAMPGIYNPAGKGTDVLIKVSLYSLNDNICVVQPPIKLIGNPIMVCDKARKYDSASSRHIETPVGCTPIHLTDDFITYCQESPPIVCQNGKFTPLVEFRGSSGTGVEEFIKEVLQKGGDIEDLSKRFEKYPFIE